MTKNRIIIAESGRYRIIDYREIRYIEGHGSYSTIYWEQNKSSISKNLKQIEETLDCNAQFIRVHQSFMVNINQIKDFQIKESQIITSQDEVLPISRGYKKEIIAVFKNQFEWL
ncbi:MAG: LytTR family DNA-binding domain-containing protein [Bacteroidales bacterium]